ncbi:MAG: protoporphyrinogen oxidase HemJ [Methylicorpusculum sp.]|uniref:protoporphyrinogen oxidase HemJ n=1 Tax=Methylicorpusculum sp. TaxID=2713644 RepID=UPI00271F493A|nr:protoporphyrinogen oxidase HemJ [Methylicorpusculum sp.]MDO8939395.1 protoporphyrinogen oxidase HemJ [Methylicorpusculum sp.]MDP2201794.1 protoporphyrinogen oxidase HemJ [Methylicorpusculum sp.]
MLWLKALHLIFMVTWFAGLFYLPRLYVYHTMSSDEISNERFKVMERKLFFGIMTPGMIVTFIFGIWMLVDYAWVMYSQSGWLHVKLTMLALMVIYHVYCGKWLLDFKHDRNTHSHVYFRWMNEVPVLFLIGIIILAVVKPF